MTNNNTTAMMKQIYLLLSSAIVLFLLSTLLLMTMLPSPNTTDNNNDNSARHDIVIDGGIGSRTNGGISSSSSGGSTRHHSTTSSVLLPPLIGIADRRDKLATKDLILRMHHQQQQQQRREEEEQQQQQQQNRTMTIDGAPPHHHHTRQQRRQQLHHDDNIPVPAKNTLIDDDDDGGGKRKANLHHHLLSTDHHRNTVAEDGKYNDDDDDDDEKIMEEGDAADDDDDRTLKDDGNNLDIKGRRRRSQNGEEIMEKEREDEDTDNDTDDETTLREKEKSDAADNNSNGEENDHNGEGRVVVDVVKITSRKQQQQHHHHHQQSSNNHHDEPRLIHILETRFMQNQPNLIELAKARLRLFETICLPTVLKQSAWGKFIWIIRTDPKLDSTIKEELIHILQSTGALTSTKRNSKKRQKQEMELTYVIGSNDNYVMSGAASNTTIPKGIRPFDIHSMLHNAVTNPQTIFAGSVNGMNKLLLEVSNKTTFANDVVIWTRLDADDGINIAYINYIQNEATRYFLPQLYPKRILESIVDETPETLIVLASGITRDMLAKRMKQLKKDKKRKDNGDVVVIDNPNDEEDGGVVDVVMQDEAIDDEEEEDRRMIKNVYIPPQWTYWCAGRNLDWFITDPTASTIQTNNNNGSVYPVIHMNMCVTPGITIALRGSYNPLHIPRLDHDKIISTLRPQGGKLCNRKGRSVFDMNEGGLHGYQVDDGSCFHMVTVGVAAVRSRTPTSAGMLGVQPDATQRAIVAKTPTVTNVMWNSMKKEFGISNRQLVQTNTYFTEHIFDIAKENAKGQCTAGHSCKVCVIYILSNAVHLNIFFNYNT
jgi:hypothetical protein